MFGVAGLSIAVVLHPPFQAPLENMNTGSLPRFRRGGLNSEALQRCILTGQQAPAPVAR